MKNAIIYLSLLILPWMVEASHERVGIHNEELPRQVQIQFEGADSSEQRLYRVAYPGVVALPIRIDASQAKVEVNKKGQYEISNVKVTEPYLIVNRQEYVDTQTTDNGIGLGLVGALVGSFTVLPIVHILTGSWLVAGAALFLTVAAGFTAGALIGNLRASRKPTYYEKTSVEGVTLTAAH